MTFKEIEEAIVRKRAFGELELSVLKIVKDQSSITVRGVLQLLGGDNRYTTIMTVMNRLVEKGELAREKKGRQYEYCVVEEKIQQSFSLLERLKEKIFGGQSLAMISYLLESSEDISDDHLAEIERTIKNAREAKNDK